MSHGLRRPRGFSLLELVVAIAIMLAITAISVPIIQGVIADRSFDTATGAVLDHLQIARSHAQLTGEATMVVYRDDPPRLEVRQLHNDDESDAVLATEDDLMSDPDDEEVAGTLVATAFAVRHLAARVQMQSTRPESALDTLENELDQEWPETDSPDYADGAFDDEFSDTRVSFTLVVYLPDGSALPGGEIWMVDSEQRLAQIVIDPFTGQGRLERIVESPPDDEMDDELGDEMDSGADEDERFDAAPETTSGSGAIE